MALTTQFLFNRPQKEIASLVLDRLMRCDTASIVVGFATEGGLAAILPAFQSNPNKLQEFVLGAATSKGYAALDQFIALGVPPNRLLVHLGHTRLQGSNAFVKFHPMMHSKIFLMEMPDGLSAAFVGSHNLSHFAFFGKNGEAGVLVEGNSSDPEFVKIRDHISEARGQSIPYNSGMKAALAWWTAQFIEGLRREINDKDDAIENRKTFVILAANGGAGKPKSGDVIYFEIPAGLRNITNLGTEVHVFVFDSLPSSPEEALTRTNEAAFSLRCQTLGLELQGGGVELQADWEISNRRNPILQQTRKPFRPPLTQNMQQVRVIVKGELKSNFEYLFGLKPVWKPILESDVSLHPDEKEQGQQWLLVRGLTEAGASKKLEYTNALLEASPQAGNFVLFSPRRVDLSKQTVAGEDNENMDN